MAHSGAVMAAASIGRWCLSEVGWTVFLAADESTRHVFFTDTGADGEHGLFRFSGAG